MEKGKIKFGDILYFRLLDFQQKINYDGYDKLDLVCLDKLRHEVDIKITAIKLEQNEKNKNK